LQLGNALTYWATGRANAGAYLVLAFQRGTLGTEHNLFGQPVAESCLCPCNLRQWSSSLLDTYLQASATHALWGSPSAVTAALWRFDSAKVATASMTERAVILEFRFVNHFSILFQPAKTVFSGCSENSNENQTVIAHVPHIRR